jgi:hypothetical protein
VIRLVALLGLMRSCRCPIGYYVGEGVRSDGMLVCVSIPPRGCEDTGPAPIKCPESSRVPWFVACPRTMRPVVDQDGLGAACRIVGN